MAKRSKATKKDYDASSIVYHEGLSAVRAKPSLYVGGTDSAAMLHCVKEIVSNSLDEWQACRREKIGPGEIVVHLDGLTVTVWDYGRGIPVGPHPKHKGLDALTLAVGYLNAGGKMNDEAYAHSTGVHGQGSAAVNALSTNFQVWTFRKGRWWSQTFEKGNPTSKVVQVKPTAQPSYPTHLRSLPKHDRGTIIRFSLDPSCFSKGAKIDVAAVREWVRAVTWFVPARVYLAVKDDKPEVFHSPKGVAALFSHLVESHKTEALFQPFILQSELVDVAIGWVKSDIRVEHSAVNAVQTRLGGTHSKAVADALHSLVSGYKTRKDSFTRDDLMAGSVVVVNVRMHGASFSSQDKQELVSDGVVELVKEALVGAGKKAPLVEFLRRNKAELRAVMDRANEITKIAADSRASRKLAIAVRANKDGKVALPPDLRVCESKNPDERELYVCEGLSSCGCLIAARDPKFQEILPLTGKPPNVWRDDRHVASNQRLIDVLKSIGYDPKAPGVYRVGKIILAADSDADGNQINALLIGLLYKVIPEAFDAGRVYVMNAPLFIYRTKTDVLRGPTRADIERQLKAKGLTMDATNITRIKGLGEFPAPLLREAGMDPTTRSLIKLVRTGDAAEHASLLGMLGPAVEARKVLLGIDTE